MKERKGYEIPADVIERLKPEFLSDDIKVQQPYPIYRVNTKHGRMYVKVYDDGSYVYGVGTTSILQAVMNEGYGLSKWQRSVSAGYGSDYVDWYLEHSANYGTWMHVVYAKLLRQEAIDMTEQGFFRDMEAFYGDHRNGMDFYAGMKWYKHAKRNYKKDILSFIQWAQDYEIEPIAIEYQFVTYINIGETNVFNYSGTIDLVCKGRFDKRKKYKEVALIDFKTGKGFFKSHEAQLHMYKEAWNIEDFHEFIPDLKVEKVYNFAPKDFRMEKGKSPTYNFVNQTKSREQYKILNYLSLFRADHEDLRIETEVDVYDTEVTIDKKVDDLYFEHDILEEILPTDEEIEAKKDFLEGADG